MSDTIYQDIVGGELRRGKALCRATSRKTDGQKKSSSDSQTSFWICLEDISKPVSDLSVRFWTAASLHRYATYTSVVVNAIEPRWSWHLTQAVIYLLLPCAGCQGVIGPFPSAFLDKRCLKNCCKCNDTIVEFPNAAENFWITDELGVWSPESEVGGKNVLVLP